MRTPTQVSLIGIAALLTVSACASADAETSADENDTTVPATTVPDTLPTPTGSAAPWAAEAADSWDALLAANHEATLEYLEVFDGYTPEEVVAYRDLISHPAIAAAVAAFPEAPTDPDLADLYDKLVTALNAELGASSDAAAQIDANLEAYQSAAGSGTASGYDEIRTAIADARDATTLACLNLASAIADRDLATLDCIEGPDDGGTGDAEPIAGGESPPPDFEGEPLTIVGSIEHASDELAGPFTVTSGHDALGCRAGTWMDVDFDVAEYVCEDGARSGTMVIVTHYEAEAWWEFTGGDGDFTSLSGGGTVAVDVGDDATTFTLDGRAVHTDGSEAAAECDMNCPIGDAARLLVEASVAAYNSGDWDAWLATIVDAEPAWATPVGGQTTDLVEYDFIWSAAMNDVWTLGDCVDVLGDIHCDLTIEDDLHRGLADRGLTPSECRLIVAIEDGLVDWKRYNLSPCHDDYDRAMHAFGGWFEANFPGEAPIQGMHYRGWNQADSTAGERAASHLQAWLDSGEAELGEHHH